jgi:hypothetical protein
MKLTDAMVTQLQGYSERFQIVTLKQWKARGYDLGEYSKILEGPSLARRVTNFGKAMAGHVKNGCKLAPVEEQERRLSICGGCEFFGLRKPGVCGHKDCGCPMGVKVTLASSFCPATPRLWDNWTCDSACTIEQSGPVENPDHLPLVEARGKGGVPVRIVSTRNVDAAAAITNERGEVQQQDTSEFHDGN